MFASDLKIISLTANDVIACKSSDNTSPMIKYQKQHNNSSQKYQNNLTHHHNNNNGNRKKNQKIPTINSENNNSCNTNKNHHNTNGHSYATNNRKKLNNNNHHQFNITCNTKSNNNSNTIKNQNVYIATSGVISTNVVNKMNNNTTSITNNCSDSNLLPKSCCDTLVSSKNIASDQISTSSFQKPSASSNSLVSSSSSLSSSSSSSSSSSLVSSASSSASSAASSTANISTSSSINNNKGRVAIRFGTASTHHRRKPPAPHQNSELDINNKKSPVVPIMVVTSSSGSSTSNLLNNQQLPAVFTAPICTTSIASSSAPVSPSSYSLDFLHSVGVQMTGGVDSSHLGRNHHHVYSSSATVSPTRNAQNMIVQGQRIIYQDIPPPEKRTLLLDHGQHKYSPKVHSPSYSEYPSYDIPILINNTHHPGGECFSSPFNYPPLYKRNSYIPVSYQYQKSQNESNTNGTNTPTYNRNRNQAKTWNTGNASAHKNPSKGTSKHNGGDSVNSQMNPRIKNHQNINNLTYVTTDPNNNRYLDGNNRSQSASPKSENLVHVTNKTSKTTSIGKGGDSFISPGDGTHLRVASEGYESDSSNSSCGKKVNTGRQNFLSSSSSSISSTDVPYHPPPSIASRFNFPTSFAEDDFPLQHFYGSEQNLSHWIPALHAQFLYSAHGTYTPNETSNELQQQQIKKGQTHRNSFRGGRGRNYIQNNVRSVHVTNEFFFTPPDRFLARSHLVEIKEVPRKLLTCSKWDNLSQGIWNRFVTAQQTEDTFKRKMRLWRYLYIIIKNAYPRFGLYLVGSTISGFGADTSDIDMCLVSRAISTIDPRMEALFNLTLLRDCLMKTGEFEKFNLIEAKVPILRFKDKAHNLEVDLNFNNCVGIKNTHLLFCYSQLDWRLRPLVLVTKLWAQYHNINNAKNMTISSYSLVLMVIHFLQCAVSPPVLPCLHEMYPDKFQFIHRTNDFGYVDMNETIGPYESQNSQTIGNLFLQFLQYYSNFNYSQFAISIRTGALIPVEYCRQAKSLKNDIHQWKELCIEEPFDLTNTARSVYDYETFERVKLVFVSSFRVLQETLDINSIFTPLIPVRPVQEN